MATRAAGRLFTPPPSPPAPRVVVLRDNKQVNEKFEQLLQVLEQAEQTSGLELPSAAEGQTAANACINGRRVEVLSRTITVLKKLLAERSDSPSSSSTTTPEECRILDDGRLVEDETLPGFNTTVPAPASSVLDCAASVCPSGDTSEANAAPNNPPSVDGVHPTAASEAAVTATAAAGSTPTPAAVYHMAVPMPGHPSASVPPGFAGMPAGVHHGMSGQPIFIALPMYMPPGQGVASVETSAQAQAQAPSVSAGEAPATAVVAPGGGSNPGSMPAAGKEAGPMPSGLAHQAMITLQMPHFVTQALSTEEGDEKPTHAVCA